MGEAAQKHVPFRVREYMGESGFVAGTWLRNYLSSPWARRLSQDEYYRHHAPLVAKLIERSVVLVAEHADPEMKDLLLGYAVGERDEHGAVVHYVYVKGEFREQAIGGALVRGLLDALKVSAPERKTLNAWLQVVGNPKNERDQYKAFAHSLVCGHKVLWDTRRDAFPCFHCVPNAVRYTHSRAPGCDLAARLGWTYTPYPALRHGWER